MTEGTPAPKVKGKLSAIVNRKVLGVRVLYLAALAVIILAYFAWSTSRKPADTGATDPAGTAGLGDLGAVTDSETGDGGGGVPTLSTGTVYGTSTPISEPDPTNLDDNDQWSKRAIAWGDANGLGALATQQAVQQYLSGGSLSYDQSQIVSKVIKQFGPPPDLPTGTTVADKPAQKQGNPPVHHKVQGKNDNTYGLICDLYYGRHDQETIDLVQGANPALGNAPFAPGSDVYIPVYHLPKYYVVTPAVKTLAQIAAKNGTSQEAIVLLNNGKIKFPAAPGTHVRVS